MREFFLILTSFWNNIKQALPHCVICIYTDALLHGFASVPSYCTNSWNSSCLKAFQAINLLFLPYLPEVQWIR